MSIDFHEFDNLIVYDFVKNNEVDLYRDLTDKHLALS